ncbi:MAG: hypothetical protein J1G02_05900 [Clostridiales bacterium]|nr:hypothetical protein [Clostridiales bacterium]
MNKDELERYLWIKGSFTIAEVQQRFGLSYAVVRQLFREMEEAGKIYLESGVTFKYIPQQRTVIEQHQSFDENDVDDDELDNLFDSLFDDEDVTAKPAVINSDVDPLCKKALRYWLSKQGGRASIASIQRNLGIGFNRAGRIMDTLQKLGYVENYVEGMPSSRPLRVLVTLDELDKLFPDLPD